MVKPNSLQRALPIVKILVGLEYALLILYVIILPSLNHLARGANLSLVMSSLGLFVLGFLFFMGMRLLLKTVTNRAAVELWSLLALATSPICGLVYTVLATTQLPTGLNYWLTFRMIVGIIGFISPFVLLTCWVKYHHREDEF